MAFLESIKLEAKRLSRFQCVVCSQPFVEVHHIIPQAEGGADALENACPLCASCHDLIGGNRDKRKQLREMRDLQWELNGKREQNPDLLEFNQKLDAIQSDLKLSASGQAKFLEEMKALFIAHNKSTSAAIEQADTLPAFTAATGVTLPSDAKLIRLEQKLEQLEKKTNQPPVWL